MNVKTHVASEFSFFLSSIVISKGSDSQKKKKKIQIPKSLTPLQPREFSFFLSSIVIYKGSDSQKKKKKFQIPKSLTPLHSLKKFIQCWLLRPLHNRKIHYLHS